MLSVSLTILMMRMTLVYCILHQMHQLSNQGRYRNCSTARWPNLTQKPCNAWQRVTTYDTESVATSSKVYMAHSANPVKLQREKVPFSPNPVRPTIDCLYSNEAGGSFKAESMQHLIPRNNASTSLWAGIWNPKILGKYQSNASVLWPTYGPWMSMVSSFVHLLESLLRRL